MEQLSEPNDPLRRQSSDLPRGRRRGLLLAMLGLSLFVGEVALFAVRWELVGGGLFGGDVTNTALHLMETASLRPVDVLDANALCRSLATDGGDANADLWAFVRTRLRDESIQAARRVADGQPHEGDFERLVLDINRSVLDKPTPWPLPILRRAGVADSPAAGEPIWRYNRRVIQGASNLIHRPQSWEYAGRGLLGEMPRIAALCFRQDTPTRFAPLTRIYTTAMGMYCDHNEGNLWSAAIIAGIPYGLLMVCVFFLAYYFLRSPWWALAALGLYQFSMGALTMSFTLFALPYSFVPLAMAGGLLCYLLYKRGGRVVWLVLFVLFGIAAPWFREFSGGLPFVVFACEVLRFRGRRSVVLLAVCVLLMLHSAYPSALPWAIGVNTGRVYGVYEQGNVQHQISDINYWAVSVVFVQFPPLLWALSLAGVAVWLWRWSTPRTLPGLDGPRRRLLVALWAKRWVRLTAGLAVAVGMVLAVRAFVLCFYVINADLTREGQMLRPSMQVYFLIAFLLLSMRFGPVLSVYTLLVLPVFLRVYLAEVHFSFLVFPVAILLTLWVKDLADHVRGHLKGKARTVAMAAIAGVGAVAVGDQVLNLYATLVTQAELNRCNVAMGQWIGRELPRHSAVLCNFYNFDNVYRYSGMRFDPWETKLNCPLGQGRVIETREKLREFWDRSGAERGVYLLGGERGYYLWQENWDPNPFTRHPPGKITPLASFSARVDYPYLDPLKYFTPPVFVSFPGYMDWRDDFSAVNLRRVFLRRVYCDYTLYHLEDLSRNVLVVEVTASDPNAVVDPETVKSNRAGWWEQVGPFPHWLQVRVGGQRPPVVRSYVLLTANFGPGGIDSTSRMPRKWRLLASDGGADWREVDRRANEGDWRPDEQRRYVVAAPGPYRYYRLVVDGTSDPRIVRICSWWLDTIEDGKPATAAAESESGGPGG